MIAFVCLGRPPSWNKRSTQGRDFLDVVRREHGRAGGVEQPGPLYGVIYWFVRRYDTHTDPDADNISKPVWDALNRHAFADDKQVRLRISAVVEIGAADGGPSVESVDITAAPPVLSAALEAFLLESGEDEAKAAVRTTGICYVEIGRFRSALLRFGMTAEAAGAEERT